MPHKIDPDFTLVVDDQLTLRLATVDDAQELFTLVDKNREYLRTFLGWVDTSKELSDTKKYIEENLPQWLCLKALHLSIYKANDLVGAIGLHQIDYLNKVATIGYWLDKKHQGQGIMTKSVKALIDYLFTTLKLHRIEMRCAIHNHQSQKIPERLGFQKEGTLKDAIYLYGKYFDAYLYGLVAPL